MQRTRIVNCGGRVKLKLRLIPAGEFIMGADYNRFGSAREHKVTINKPFYMGIYQVTQEQFEAVMGRNPSKFKGARRPVERVTWQDAVDFCEELAKRTGVGIRLPSEAEWEYACRAGSRSDFCFGDGMYCDDDFEQLFFDGCVRATMLGTAETVMMKLMK